MRSIWCRKASWEVVCNIVPCVCGRRAYRQRRQRQAPSHCRRHLVTTSSGRRRVSKSKSTLQYQVRHHSTTFHVALAPPKRPTVSTVQVMCADAPSLHWSSAVLSPRVRHCISRRHFTSSSAIHQQSAIWTGSHVSEVRWTFVLVCRTKSLEQSPVFTARTHRHQNFQTQTTDLLFQQAYHWTYVVLFVLFLFYFILFYFSSHYVICWSILFCKRNSLWTMNYVKPIILAALNFGT